MPITFLLLGQFWRYLWGKETKYNTFWPPPKKWPHALSKRCKRLKRKFRLKIRNFKFSLKSRYMVPFLPFFQNLAGIWKNNPFPSPTSFLVLKQHFKRLEIAFWRKFKILLLKPKNGHFSGQKCLDPYIFFAFGPI